MRFRVNRSKKNSLTCIYSLNTIWGLFLRSYPYYNMKFINNALCSVLWLVMYTFVLFVYIIVCSYIPFWYSKYIIDRFWYLHCRVDLWKEIQKCRFLHIVLLLERYLIGLLRLPCSFVLLYSEWYMAGA